MSTALGSQQQHDEAVTAPPRGERLRFELYGHRLPPQYRGWVARDIAGRWWPWRQAAIRAVMCSIGFVAVAAVTDFRPESLVAVPAFLLGGALVTPLVADRWRASARRGQGIDGDRPMWVSRLSAALTVVVLVAFGVVLVAHHPIADAMHPDRCATVPRATRVAIVEAGDAGATFSGFHQRRHGRWTGIAGIVTIGPNRSFATWVEDRSVAPHRIVAADTNAAARTPRLSTLDSGPGFADAMAAAQSAVSCLALTR